MNVSPDCQANVKLKLQGVKSLPAKPGCSRCPSSLSSSVSSPAPGAATMCRRLWHQMPPAAGKCHDLSGVAIAKWQDGGLMEWQ